MSQTFKCPNCGAPLKYDGGPDAMIECPYCQNPVIVPEELRSGPAPADVLSEVARLAGPLAEIARLVRSGRKIEAVKLYRQTFGVGLQEAEEAVDKIERGEPVTMTSVTVESITDGEPVATTDRERRAKGIASASIAVSAASMATPVATIAVILACLAGFALMFYAIGILPLRSHPVYRAAMELVKNDPAVVELFGSPVKDSLFVAGTLERFRDGSESLNTQVGIRGPRARGTAHIWGKKEKGGTVHVHSIWIEIGGEEVLEYSDSEPEKGFRISPAAPPTYLPPTPVSFASAVLQFGGEGIGPGWFQDARSIAVDGAGHIYVAEYDSGRVQVFDPNGTFISQWFVGDSGKYIYDMTADRGGMVYVAAYGTILRVEGATGRLLGELGPPDGRYWFEQVARMPDGGLLALDKHDNLVRFDTEGNVTQVFQDVIRSVIGDSESIRDLAVDGLGNIFIAGVFDPTIFKFTPEGRFVDRFGGRGDAPGQFHVAIEAIAVDNQGRIYAADWDGIKVLDATGGYLGMFEVEGVVRAMVFNDQNELFVVTGAQQVTKFRLSQP